MAMISACLTVLIATVSLADAASMPAGSIERIVVFLGENDTVTSSRVLGQLKSCMEGRPTAVVSAFRGIRIEKDFPGSQSLAARLPAEKIAKRRTLPASLQLLAEALAPIGPTTAVVLVSPHVGSQPVEPVGSFPASPDGKTSFETVTVPQSVFDARKALRDAGLTVVAVNTDGQYDAGALALTGFPRGHYLRYSDKDFPKAFVSAVCGPGR
jgi:hypothetical protein